VARFTCRRLDNALNLSTQQLSFTQPINLPSARLSLSATPKLINPDDDFGTGVPDDVRGARASGAVGWHVAPLFFSNATPFGIAVAAAALRGHSP